LDYAIPSPPQLLIAGKNTRHPTELATLYGKRVVAASETEDGCRLTEALVKQLTGGDLISARRCNEDFWSFKPSHTFVMATNHKPIIRGTDHGIWRRIHLIPFNVTISEAERDPYLTETLRGEYGAILRWAVEGCSAWQRDGKLITPIEVEAATSAYRVDSDVLGEFIDERCIVGPGYSTSAGDIFAAYQQWIKARSECPLSQKRFGPQLAERGFIRRKQGLTIYEGIGLRSSG
jgi:putative DNA primase/helicase